MNDIPCRRRLLGGGAALAALALAGCGGGPAPVTYDLSAVRQGLRRGGSRGIVVVEPSAIFALDSERIVVRAASGEITYLPRAQWSDKLPRLLQTRLIQSFENAGRAAVGRPTDRLANTAQLLVDIRSFEVREASRDAFVEVAAKLVASGTGRVANARMFAASAPVGAIDGQGATQALDQAFGAVTAQIVAWAG